MFLFKIPFSYFLCFCYLLRWSFLGFLHDTMRGDDQRFEFRIPKGEQPITVAIEQSTKLPNIGTNQLFEELLVYYSLLNLEKIIRNLLLYFCGSKRKKAKASSIITTFI